MSVISVTQLLNGSQIVDWYTYKCDVCGISLPESFPRLNKAQQDFCWECAFKQGLINEAEYLKICGIYLKNIHVGINPSTGEIQLWTSKRPPWEPRKGSRRTCISNLKWRDEIFKRDNYTCKQCGKVGGRLNAHHIKSWAEYPKLRYILANGITLCEPCHKKTPNYLRKCHV